MADGSHYDEDGSRVVNEEELARQMEEADLRTDGPDSRNGSGVKRSPF